MLKNLTTLNALADAPNRSVSAILPMVASERYDTPAAAAVQAAADFDPSFAAQFLEPRTSDAPRIDLAVLRDVYVLPNGAIVTIDGRVLAESLEPYVGDTAISRAFAPWLEKVEDRLELRLGAVRTATEPLFHFREHGDQGFFHWMHSVLPKWEIARHVRLHPGIALLSPTKAPFNRTGLELIGVDAARTCVAAPEETIFARELWFVTPLVHRGDFWSRPLFVPRFYRRMTPLPAERSRLYVTRRDASFRNLRNEEALVAALAPLGFRTVSLAGMDFPQQLALFRGAEVMLGVHGAGLSHLVSMEPGGKLLEILSPQRFWPTYRALASRAGIDYGVVVGSADADADANSPIDVEVGQVLAVLEEMGVTAPTA